MSTKGFLPLTVSPVEAARSRRAAANATHKRSHSLDAVSIARPPPLPLPSSLVRSLALAPERSKAPALFSEAVPIEEPQARAPSSAPTGTGTKRDKAPHPMARPQPQAEAQPQQAQRDRPNDQAAPSSYEKQQEREAQVFTQALLNQQQTRQKQRAEMKAKAAEAARAAEAAAEAFRIANKRADPKVFGVGNIPRDLLLERKRREYSSKDIAQLLAARGLPLELDASEEHEKARASALRCASQVLSLMAFDNTDYDVRTPEEWKILAQAAAPTGIDATALRGKTWESCHVTDVSPDGCQCLAVFEDSSQEWLQRLYVLFRCEDPERFADRVKYAWSQRMRAESFAFIRTACENWAQAEAFMTMERFTPQLEAMMTESEVIELRKVFHTFERRKEMRTPNTVVTGNRQSFDEAKAAFLNKTHMINTDIVKAWYKCNVECLKFSTGEFFVTDPTKTMKLDEFDDLQTKAIHNFRQTVNDSFVMPIKNHVKLSIEGIGKGWYFLDEQDREFYEASKLKSFNGMIQRMMQESLWSLVIRNMSELAEYFDIAGKTEVTVINCSDVLIRKAHEKLGKLTRAVISEYTETAGRLQTRASCIEDVAQQKAFAQSIPAFNKDMEYKIIKINKNMDVLGELNYDVPDNEFELWANANAWPAKILNYVEICLALHARDQKRFQEEVVTQQKALQELATKLTMDVAAYKRRKVGKEIVDVMLRH
eukprot:m51a1_g1640 hypothetical protein (712) ;mRNA; f:309504-313205